MHYEFDSYINGDELMAAIEAKFDVSFNSNQQSSDFKNQLLAVADCHLQPSDAEILAEKGLYVMDCASPIYYFPDVGGANYILIKKDLQKINQSDVITVSEASIENRNYLDDFFDDYIKHLKGEGRIVNPCERYVIEQAQWWDVEDDYNRILSYYGLADCIVTTDFMEHTDIAVWVEHKYESVNDIALSSGYLKYLNGDVALFSTVEEAQAQINKTKPDLVVPTNNKETTYYITTTYPKD